MSEHDDEPASAGPRRPLPLSVFAAGAWSFAALFLQIIAISALLGARPGAKDDLVSLFACQAAAYLLIVFAMLRLHAPEASVRDFLGLRKTSWSFLPIAALLGVAIVPIADACEELIERRWPAAPDGIVELFQGAPLAQRIAMGVVLVALGPFVEEILYRGAFFQSVKRSPKIAVVVGTSCFFAIAHPIWQMWPALVTMGLVLAIVRWQSGSILPTIALHAAYNGVLVRELVVSHGAAEDHAIPWRFVGAGVLATIGLLVATFSLGKRSRAAMIAQEMDKL